MTLNEAQEKIKQNSHLIGTQKGTSIIDHLIIVPLSGDKLGDIVKQVLWEEEYRHLLFGHDDFKVLALLDIEKFSDNGLLLYEDLEAIIDKN